MKTLISIIIPLISFFCLNSVAHAQRVYGMVNTSTGEISLTTEITHAEQKFKESLSDPNAILTNFQIVTDEDHSKYMLIADVSNSSTGVNSIGVELIRIGNLVQAAAGPGIEHICTGNPCNQCKLKLSRRGAYCDCLSGKEGDKCNHTTKVVIGL